MTPAEEKEINHLETTLRRKYYKESSLIPGYSNKRKKLFNKLKSCITIKYGEIRKELAHYNYMLNNNGYFDSKYMLMMVHMHSMKTDMDILKKYIKKISLECLNRDKLDFSVKVTVACVSLNALDKDIEKLRKLGNE